MVTTLPQKRQVGEGAKALVLISPNRMGSVAYKIKVNHRFGETTTLGLNFPQPFVGLPSMVTLGTLKTIFRFLIRIF